MGENNSKNINKSTDIIDDTNKSIINKDNKHNLTLAVTDKNDSEKSEKNTSYLTSPNIRTLKKTFSGSSNTKELCINLKCVKDIIEHIQEKKRKLDLFRKILELKYHRYKSCHNFWSVSTILLSSVLTLIESCKLIFVDENSDNEITEEFFAFSPIFISTVITCSTSILKFKKYQEKMELLNNVIQNCVAMIAKLKNKKEMLQLQENCYDEDILKELINTYNDEILLEYCNIYQESQKYIKSTDYDKYAKQIHFSELYKHMIEEERQEFYKHYSEHNPKIVLADVIKQTNEKKKINNNCCGF